MRSLSASSAELSTSIDSCINNGILYRKKTSNSDCAMLPRFRAGDASNRKNGVYFPTCLADAARREKLFTSKPGRVVRCKEDGHGSDVANFSGSAERGL